MSVLMSLRERGEGTSGDEKTEVIIVEDNRAALVGAEKTEFRFLRFVKGRRKF